MRSRHRRSEGRCPDRHDSQSQSIAARAASTSAEVPNAMMRRLPLPLVFLVAGFVAGLVLTGRMRTAADSSAGEPPPARAEPAAEQRGASIPAIRGAGVAVSGGGPDFTRVAGQAVKGVANISSLQVVRTPQLAVRERSVLPLLLRRRRAVRIARPPFAQPRLRRHHLGRRLRRHQQPRRRRERPRDHGRAGRQARDQGQGHRHRSGHRHRAAEDRRHRPARSSRGAIRRSCRSASGCWRSAARSS